MAAMTITPVRTEKGFQDSIDFDLPELVHPPVKDAHTRLLDMLAGWSRYIDRDDTPDSEDVRDAVYALHQEAGAMEDSGAEAVAAFVTTRVIPLLNE